MYDDTYLVQHIGKSMIPSFTKLKQNTFSARAETNIKKYCFLSHLEGFFVRPFAVNPREHPRFLLCVTSVCMYICNLGHFSRSRECTHHPKTNYSIILVPIKRFGPNDSHPIPLSDSLQSLPAHTPEYPPPSLWSAKTRHVPSLHCI